MALNFYYFLKLLKKEKTEVGFYLSTLLVLSSDYLAYFIFPAQFIIVILQKFPLGKWLILTGLAFLSFSWWISIFLGQISNGLSTASAVPQWRQVVGSFGLKPLALNFVKFTVGRISHPNDLVYLGSLLARSFYITQLN